MAPGNRTGAAETAVASPTASYSYTSTGGGGLIGGLVKDAHKAKLGENLITNKNLTYSTSGVTAPIAGESIPLNNGIVWVEGVAFTDRLQTDEWLPTGGRLNLIERLRNRRRLYDV